MKQITLVVPYFNQPRMLARQLAEWAKWSPEARAAFQVVIVDDGSQDHPASDGLLFDGLSTVALPALYRIDGEIEWNRGGARNLGAHVADTPWLMHVDIDHVVPAGTAEALARAVNDPSAEHWPFPDTWYRFQRIRIGAADETRKKDACDPRDDMACIHPHIDSYLVPRVAYWRAGGYNEDFSGCLGGGVPFLRELAKDLGSPVVLDHPLHVHTRHSVSDANTPGLSRDTAEFTRRERLLRRAGKLRGTNPLRFPWHRVF